MTQIPPLILPPLSVLYGAITRARLALYRTGTFQAHRLDVPVISVGNIVTGGTGKTPLVEWVCRALGSEGRRPCILTRGYGRVNNNERVIVSDGARLLTSEREAGDEPFMLAEKLIGVAAVISDVDRVAAGKWAIRHLGVDIVVLDDGFQHLRLLRNLDIVTVDATNPFGGGYLLPYGRLRESAFALARADCIVVTRANIATDLKRLEQSLERFGERVPVFFSRMERTTVKTITGDQTRFEQFANKLGAFCAIGNPQSFFQQLRTEGACPLMTRAFADHYVYRQKDLHLLTTQAKQVGAEALVTTAKDAVKLRALSSPLPLFVLDLQICIDEKDRLLAMIWRVIK